MLRIFASAIVLIILILIGFFYFKGNQYPKMEKLFLITSDGKKIAANLYPAEKPISWLVLLHMMPATKESWQDFAQAANEKGYESIAIDLRGHGESTGGPDGFFNFTDADHQKSILDVQSAVDYLVKNQHATSDKIIFIGASIGANLSLQYIAEHSEFKIAVLLSPGLNYRGLKTEPLVKKLQPNQKVFFISAQDDGDNAGQNSEIYGLMPAGVGKKIQIYPIGGHGTNIFKIHPELKSLILEFIK